MFRTAFRNMFRNTFGTALTALSRRVLLLELAGTTRPVDRDADLTVLLGDDDVRTFFAESADDDLEAARRLRAFLTRRARSGPGLEISPAFDHKVAETLALVHWYRCLYLPDQVMADELALALSLFGRLHSVDPSRVPGFLVPLFDPSAGEPGKDETDVRVLLWCAEDLFAHVEEDKGGAETEDTGRGDGPSPEPADEADAERDESRAHAVALARRAMVLSLRVDGLGPDTHADLASVLLAAFDHTPEDEHGPEDEDEHENEDEDGADEHDLRPGRLPGRLPGQDLLDHAVASARQALAGGPPGDEERLDRVALLGLMLAEAADATDDEDALRESLELLRPAFHAADDDGELQRDPHWALVAVALARAATLHYVWEYADGDRNAEAIPELGHLLATIPADSADHDMVAEEIAGVLWTRYLHRPEGVPDDELPFAISLCRRLHAVDPDLVPDLLVPLFDPGVAEPGTDEDDVGTLTSCAADLFRYVEAGDGRGEHRGHALSLAARAMELGRRIDVLAPGTRADLALMLLTAFDHTAADGHPEHGLLDRAVAGARQALAGTSPDDEEWLDRVGVLGLALAEIADAMDDEDALRESLDLLRPAVGAATPGGPQVTRAALALFRAVTLHNDWYLGANARSGVATELRRLLELVPQDAPAREHMILGVLGIEVGELLFRGAFSEAQELRSSLDDLLGRFAPGTAEHDRLRLFSAMVSLPQLFLDQAMLGTGPAPAERELARYRALLRAATALDPSERATHVETLTTFLVGHADTTGDTELFGESVDLLSETLGLLPAGSHEHRSLSTVLGWTLVQRFRHTGDTTDLDEAITLLRRALTGPRHRGMDRSTVLSALGEALRERHRLTGDEHSYDEAMAALRGSVDDAENTVLARLGDAWAAGELAAQTGRWDDAADVLADGVALSAQLAWRGMSRTDQEQNLMAWSGMVSEAAAAAALAGAPERAVELLEQGRAVLFHQGIDVRGDPVRVRAELPELARRLDAVRTGIDTVRTGIDDTGERRRRYDLAHEWDRLVTEIRAHPGFAAFLRPPGLPELRPAADQTVVVVNVADFGSEAFVVTAAGVRAVPLPGLTGGDVAARVDAFHDALAARIRGPGTRERRAALDVIEDVLDWLWRTTAEPILGALGHTAAPEDGSPWPRIHWCPTWRLSFLPLHAAAARSPAPPGASVLDRVVSSYTVSLRTLRFAGRHRDPPPGLRSLLVVSMPETPGLAPLPGARHEAAALSRLVAGAEVLSGERAVHQAVRRALRDHAWAHFACHAAQDAHNPSGGRLFLHDHRTHPFTVLDISRLRLEHAQLAFLSACETARGGLRLPDEALHVGGALQLAGYQHVIATMWPVADMIADRVTALVYDRLRTRDASVLDPARAADALHHATRALRRSHPGDPTLWAGYVHFGP